MKEPGMGFFPKFFYSITSFAKYRYFLRQRTGAAIAYLLVITLVISAAIHIPAYNTYSKAMDSLIANFDTTIPDFRFSNGKLEVSGEMPIIIEDSGASIVIDTSPNAEDAILDKYDTVILITSDKIIQKNYVDKTVTSLSAFQGLEMSRDDIKQSLPFMKPVSIFIFVLMGIFFICGKFISVLFVSLIGLVLNSAKRTNLSYRSIFKISSYAVTLPLLLCTFLNLMPVAIPFLWLLFYLIASVYVYGAINTIRKELDSISNDSYIA